MNRIYSQDAFLLKNGDGDIVTAETYEAYFKHYVKIYAGNNTAEFRKVEIEDSGDCFVLEYAVSADWCGDCDEAGITEGICEGHGEPRFEYIYYKRVNIFA